MKRTKNIVGVFLVAVACAACSGAPMGSREKGALGGAALGAGLGAIVGNQAGNAGAGVAIGSAFGAITGGLIGNEMDKQDAALNEREKRLSDQDREIAENRRLIEELKSRGVDARSSSRGVVANLPDVLFEFDSARLTGEARSLAGEIADVAKGVRGRTIAVEGHTDSIGTVAYNERLSEARARAVADELVARGITRSSLRVKGLGESKPVASNETESGRQRNRRVEVIIENR